MSKTDLTTISNTQIKVASSIFAPNRDLATVAEDCAAEALKVLYAGLDHPDSKLRLASANSILQAHCKLAAIKAPVPTAPQLPPEQRVEKLTQAFTEPSPEISEALGNAGWVQVQKQ